MSETPWKTDKWFVSPWNFNPAVNSGFKFAKNIQFHDVTLRDGEQQTGSSSRKTTRSASPKDWRKPACTASKRECPWSRPATQRPSRKS